MTQQEQSRPIVIFSGDFHRAAVIKNMLENHGIYVFMQNEHMGSIAPFQVASGGFNPVKLIISGHDEEEAKKLLENFDRDGTEGIE
ncbi:MULTISPECIES: DUF2007 domain-containing protein [Pontibacter]|uniref:Putative signal transducing protein n=1 Tax=Pontibacter lucknowensis TaxID=1077936 RepID=A0A1N6UAX4_9BACT|nr:MULTISPECIES: DUF2007 domain-containing protein [Pontibacter]EJF11762.1 hypothetical protein O71_00827 [Pontibacter sp. BAB1700]SIQ62828.1 Putative signal transducing protein [Pontibacter lucknowensis]